MSCLWDPFLSRRNTRLLLKYSSAIIICPPLLRAEADDRICRVDHQEVAVDPGEKVPIRHTLTIGIKPGTTCGSLRRSRTAKPAHISRRAMKLCCACKRGGSGRLSVDGSG